MTITRAPGLLPLSLLLALSTASAWAAATPMGKVAEMKGKGFVLRDGNREALAPGAVVNENDVIETNSDGTATLVIQDGSVKSAVMIKPSSRIKLSGKPGQAVEIGLERGAVLSSVNTPDYKKRPQPFRVRTKSATMGVRGTVFFVKADVGAPTFVCTCIGKVHIEHDKFGAMDIESKHHDAPKQIQENAGNWLLPAPMGTDHADAEAGVLMKLSGK
jgi:hypothetical protein